MPTQPTFIQLFSFLEWLPLSRNKYKLTVIIKSEMNIAGRNHKSLQRREVMLEALNTLNLKCGVKVGLQL